MSSDVGSFKPVLPTAVQIQRTAPTGRTDRAADANRAEAVQRAERAENDKRDLDEVVTDLNQLVRELHRELQFSVDTDSGDTVVKVVDRATDEVLRQIPSEDLVRLRKRLEEAAGVFFKDSA